MFKGCFLLFCFFFFKRRGGKTRWFGVGSWDVCSPVLTCLSQPPRRLREAGADFVVMPCVTAHYFFGEVMAQEKFPFLNILDEALQWTKKNLPGLKKAGLISTTGTLESRLIHDAFRRGGIEVTGPEDEERERVMEAIFGKKGIKAGYTEGKPKKIIVDTAHRLIDRGAEAIIAGCTEVPLVLKGEDISVPLIEPMSIMAEAAIVKAGYELRGEREL